MNKKRKEEIIKIFYEKIDACRLWHKEEIMSALHDYLEGQKITDCDEKIIVKGFRDSFFPYIGEEIKEYFEELKALVNPDLIFTHYRHDLHQDHRLISDLTWNTFRDHLIFEYEIPKYDGDLSSPNFFIHLSQKLRHGLRFSYFRFIRCNGFFCLLVERK